MPAYDGTARVGVTLDKFGFGLLTLNGVPIPATAITLECEPGEQPYINIHIRPEEVRVAIEAANLRVIVDDEAPVEPAKQTEPDA
jgi:hypothetical protein